MYGKQTETAIAAVSYLAELWKGTATRRVSAADIADARGLQRPFVAKLLSALSQSGIVSGSPGPGGGYALAKAPAEVRLRDVWTVFERPEPPRNCPFAGERCTPEQPCPLHARIAEVNAGIDQLLDETTFDVFVDANEGTLEAAEPVAGRITRLSSNGHASNGHATNGHVSLSSRG